MSVKVFVPRDATALSLGAEATAAAIAREAAARSEAVTIVRTGSRGMHWLEPLVEVDGPDGRIAYGPVTTADVSGLFDAGFLRGGDHALGQGLTEEIPFLKNQERLIFRLCGVIDPVSVPDYRDHGGFRGLERALEMTPEQIVQEVLDSGLRGRGGAGFPTGIKWRTVLEQAATPKYIACNADEGDSGTFADRMIMEGDPFLLIEGMTIAALATGADHGYIYVRSEYPHAIQTLNEAIKGAYEAQWLGPRIHGTAKHFDLEVRVGAGAYICGEETSMLESLEGKRGIVRYKPPIPAIEGLFGKPTVINNVITLTSVPMVLAEGAAAYRDFGVGKSHGTQPWQLAGNIKRGGLVEKAFGISLRRLIDEFGGGTLSGWPIRAVQVGGPLGSYLPESMLDVPLDYEQFAAAGGMVGHGGVVVFDDTVDMAQQARFSMEFCQIESCGKCTPCRIGSVRGKETIDRIIQGIDREKNLLVLDELCEVMRDGSMCAMGGLIPNPVVSAVKHFPEDFDRAPRQVAAE